MLSTASSCYFWITLQKLANLFGNSARPLDIIVGFTLEAKLVVSKHLIQSTWKS